MGIVMAIGETRTLPILAALACLAWTMVLSGCMAQQADLKSTERRLKQSNEELAQRGALQRQELEEIRGQEIPRLRGELDRALHQAQELQGKQEDLKQRSAALEQQTKKLEQLAGKLDAENTNRYSQVRESLNAQDLKNKSDRDQLRSEVNNRLDEINRQMELLRKDIIEAVQKTNSALAKNVDLKLDEQRKALADNQVRTEQLSSKFSQFSQVLTGFRDSLNGLSERIVQEEQASKAMALKMEADAKGSAAHINETTKSVTGHLNEVNKSVSSVAQKFAARLDEQDHRLDGVVTEVNKSMASYSQKLAARLDEQDHRLDALSKTLDQVSQEAQLRGGGKNGQRQQAAKPAQRSSLAPSPLAAAPAQEVVPHQEREVMTASIPEPERTTPTGERAGTSDDSEETPKQTVGRQADRPDKVEYERLLGSFRDGDLDGARQGFAAFLTQYPNSDLAPNARYWLGESHYGKKDYKQAIDAYDRVELDYPQSEKVPAAILKKGYAYLALKDKKRASSAFKQVVTLYPKSLEAGKAYDKLSQLKESR